MLLLIIILVLLFGGGGGYYGYSRWGAGGGLGILGTVLLIVLVLYLLGMLRLPCEISELGSTLSRSLEPRRSACARRGLRITGHTRRARGSRNGYMRSNEELRVLAAPLYRGRRVGVDLEARANAQRRVPVFPRDLLPLDAALA